MDEAEERRYGIADCAATSIVESLRPSCDTGGISSYISSKPIKGGTSNGEENVVLSMIGNNDDPRAERTVLSNEGVV